MTTLSELMVEIPLRKLKKAPWNYKRDDAELAEKLKANIRRNGQLENIVVREIRGGFEIVNGNHRYDAMKDLGFEFVTCANLGAIDLDQAKRIAVELNETRFASDESKLSELMIGLVGKFGKEDILDTSPFNSLILDTMIDPSLLMPPSDPAPTPEFSGGGSDGASSPKLDLPFSFVLRFHERDLIEWMHHLKTLREGYAVSRNEDALLALVRSFAPTCQDEIAGFQKVLALLPPNVMGALKDVEGSISKRLEEFDRTLAEYIASFGAEAP